jgi:hypothetical protein
MHKRLISFFCLATVMAFMVSVLPTGGWVFAQTPGGACPPYNPALAAQPNWFMSLSPECREKYKAIRGNGEKTEVGGQTLSPGPDNYGYTSEAVTYSWTTAGTASGLEGDDEYTGPIDLGFTFPFYENSYSQVYLSTNGLITLGDWSYGYPYGAAIPSPSSPNNLIAPFWADLAVGSTYNSGAIYYSQGGSAPNRFFVVEYRDVTYWSDTSTAFSFEAILYENGNVVFQYKSLPADYYSVAVGIENSDGMDGLQYHYNSDTGLSPSTAVRFNRPTSPTARVKVTPRILGGFAGISGSTTFSFDVINLGTNGTDTYDFLGTSLWSLSLYAADGTTLLTDTDGDTYIDTGPIAQGGSTTVKARFSTPGGAGVGDYLNYDMTVRSSLDISKTQLVTFQLSIPSQFAGVHIDNGSDDMFVMAGPGGTSYFNIGGPGSDPAIARTPVGNYLYAWDTYFSTPDTYWYNIQYAVVKKDGGLSRSPADLIDNSGAPLPIFDFAPSVAVSPSGLMGITWVHEVYNPATDLSNYNIYFEILDPSGVPSLGPVNVTNDTTWGSYPTGDLIRFDNPTVAATSDNRFVLAWTKNIISSSFDDIWTAVYNSSAGQVQAASAFTTDNNSTTPVLNALNNGNVILTWQTWLTLSSMNVQNYAVLNSSGAAVKSPAVLSTLANEPSFSSDAVALPNGKIAVGWVSNGSGITFAILDSAYNLASGPTTASSIHPGLEGNSSLSMTMDYMSRVIFTWGDYNARALFYALGDSSAAFLSPLLPYVTNSIDGSVFPSWNGQGNAPVTTFADVPPDYWAWSYIERLFAAGITGGCGGGNYCPDTSVTRAQMAIFLERGMNSSTYTPPAASGTLFTDVPGSYWAASWIEKLYADGITGGCVPSPLQYCPDNAVTRAQMAIFLLRAKHGKTYTPPAAVGVFTDVPTSYWAANWIEQLATEGITGGCGGGNYCPDQPVTRAQMAIFLVRTFGLP